jgi:hypothetical protein
MASHFSALGVAFESPIYDDSIFSVAVELAAPKQGKVIAEYQPHIDRTFLNVYSPGPVPSFPEGNAATNIRLPTYQGSLHLSTPYQMFCYIAAGCVNDDRSDHLCGSAVGIYEYKEYFHGWGRDRD